MNKIVRFIINFFLSFIVIIIFGEVFMPSLLDTNGFITAFTIAIASAIGWSISENFVDKRKSNKK